MRVGTNQATAITECSGLAASRHNPHVLWAHNDSGDTPRLYALNRAGQLLGTYAITGATAEDWEDMAIGADPTGGVDHLFVGDIGDNTETRANVTIYKVEEPLVATNQFGVETNLPLASSFVAVYPDNSRDAESLMYDPWTGDLFLVSKSDPTAKVFRCAWPQNPSGTNVLEHVATLTFKTAVAADISPSGRQILVRTYTLIRYYARSNGWTVAQALANAPSAMPYTFELQDEAVCWQGREEGYYTMNEGAARPIYFYASADLDGDGAADSREVASGTMLGDGDSDNDGQGDGAEQVAGTVATNGISYFALGNVTVTSGHVRIAWNARVGRAYGVERASATNSFMYESLASGVMVSADGVYETNFAGEDASAFFRINVRDASGW